MPEVRVVRDLIEGLGIATSRDSEEISRSLNE